MPRNQISHELVSHQKCQIAQMPRNIPNLNRTINLWTLIKQEVSSSNMATLDELKRIIKEIWCKEIHKNVCKILQIPCLAAFKRLNKQS